MKTSSLAFIALLAILLAVGIYYFDQEGPPERDESGNRRLFRMDQDSISQIILVREKNSIQLQRTSARNWKLDKPIPYPADEQAVSSLLADIEFARVIRTLDLSGVENADRQRELYGLNRNDSSISIKAGDQTYDLRIGVETVRPGQYYGSLTHNSRSEVVIIDKDLPTMLENPLAYWRSKRLIELEPGQINAIMVRQGEQVTRLDRDGDTWAITRPFGSPVDSTALQSYLSTVTGARVREFVDLQAGGLASYGLNNPELAVEFHESDEKKTILRLGNPKEEDGELIYASTSTYPSIYTVPAGLKESLADIIATTRDKRLMPLNTAGKIRSIRIIPSREGEAFTVQRDADDRWHLDSSPDIRMDADLIANFLDALLQARAQSFQPIAGSDSELMKKFQEGVLAKAEVVTDGGEYQMEFGQRMEDSQMAITSYQPFLLEMDRRLDDFIPTRVYDWYPRQITLASERLERIEWLRGDRRLAVTLNEEGKWTDSEGNQPIEQDFLGKQISLLQSLRAQGRFKVDEASFHPPVLVLRLQEGDETKVIEFSLATSDGQILGREVGSEIGFLLNERDFLTLETFPIPASSPE